MNRFDPSGAYWCWVDDDSSGCKGAAGAFGIYGGTTTSYSVERTPNRAQGAVIAGGGGDGSGGPPTPPQITLREVDDCIYPEGTRTSAGFTLEVEYQVLVNGQPVLGNSALNKLGASISESVTKTSPGDIDYTGGVWCPVGGACDTAGSMTSSGTFWDDLSGQGTATQSFLFNGVVVSVSFPGTPGTQTKLNNSYNSKRRSISVGGGAVIGNSKTRPCTGNHGDPQP